MDFFKHFSQLAANSAGCLVDVKCVSSFPADPEKQNGGAVFTAITKAAPGCVKQVQPPKSTHKLEHHLPAGAVKTETSEQKTCFKYFFLLRKHFIQYYCIHIGITFRSSPAFFRARYSTFSWGVFRLYSTCYWILHRKCIIFLSKQCIVFKLSHKMYFCTTYNNCFVNAVIKSIVLYQKVNFVTFWKHWRKTQKLLFLNIAFWWKNTV